MFDINTTLENTVLVGGSGFVDPIDYGIHELRNAGADQDIIDVYLGQRLHVQTWDFVLYVVLNSDVEQHTVITVEKKLNSVFASAINQEVLKQLEKLRIDLDTITSFSWVASPGTWDLIKSEASILNWLESQGAFSKTRQQLTYQCQRLRELIAPTKETANV